MTNPMLTSQVRVALARADDWLGEVVCRTSGSAPGEPRDLDDDMRALFGLWLCAQASATSDSSASLMTAVRQVENSLRREDQAGQFSPSAHDAKLLFLVHRILTGAGASAPGIAEFAAEIATALQALPAIPPEYLGEAILLAELGCIDCPPIPSRAPAELSDGLALLRADKHQIKSVCASIASATHFGRQPLPVDPETQLTLNQVLPAILLETLRHLDLETGASLLRAARYAGIASSLAVQEAISFVLGQQERDGKFGYIAREIEEFRKTDETIAAFDVDRKIHLPITVSCLWALAEATVPGFSILDEPRTPTPNTATLAEAADGQ